MISVRGPLTQERVELANKHTWIIDVTLKRLYGNKMPAGHWEDAWQDGYIGLLAATDKWDPERGKFSTIATLFVRRAIRVGIGDLEGSSFRRSWIAHNGDEWHPPARLDAPRKPGEWWNTLARDIEAAPMVAEPEPEMSTEVALIWDHCKDELDRAICEALSNGRGAVAVVKERGLHPSLAAKRVARLRARIAKAREVA